MRLRGGWDLIDPQKPHDDPVRTTLPRLWMDSRTHRMRLVRRFGRPRLDPTHDFLLLRFERVPGLCAVTFNGLPLSLDQNRHDHWEVPLEDLPERNELVLDVNLSLHHAADPGHSLPWGEIALVIRAL
jgi:hypothetical protein